jgi:creatinine amidohydrolase
VALLPSIPFGANQNLLEFPMTISLDQGQLDGIVATVARCLEHHGIMKLVILNSHGGNDFQPGLRTLYGHSKVFCCLVNWYQAMEDVAARLFECPGEHADEMETSLLQVIAPHLVHLDWADDGGTYPPRFEGGREGWVWFPRAWERITKNSGYGDPRRATPQKGRKYLKALEKRLGKFLVELAKAKMDKTFPYDRKKKAR